MNDPQGRYATTESRWMTLPDGIQVAYLARRFLPEPEGMRIIASAALEPADRIDLFAARTLGVATAWWRIADANRAVQPETLDGPAGRRLDVPLPEAGS
jgi:hypothetical protein